MNGHSMILVEGREEYRSHGRGHDVKETCWNMLWSIRAASSSSYGSKHPIDQALVPQWKGYGLFCQFSQFEPPRKKGPRLWWSECGGGSRLPPLWFHSVSHDSWCFPINLSLYKCLCIWQPVLLSFKKHKRLHLDHRVVESSWKTWILKA